MVELHKNSEVFTADDRYLGQTVRLLRNPHEEDVDPELKLFERYLHIFNYQLPDDFFIPLEYVAGYDKKSETLHLNVSMKRIDHESLTRRPQFIAIGQAVEEALSD